MGSNQHQFAIIQFDDVDGNVEVIRTDWAQFNYQNVMTGTLFPDSTDERTLNNILRNNPKPDSTWTDNRNLWPVKKFLRFASEYNLFYKIFILLKNLMYFLFENIRDRSWYLFFQKSLLTL